MGHIAIAEGGLFFALRKTPWSASDVDSTPILRGVSHRYVKSEVFRLVQPHRYNRRDLRVELNDCWFAREHERF